MSETAIRDGTIDYFLRAEQTGLMEQWFKECIAPVVAETIVKSRIEQLEAQLAEKQTILDRCKAEIMPVESYNEKDVPECIATFKRVLAEKDRQLERMSDLSERIGSLWHDIYTYTDPPNPEYHAVWNDCLTKVLEIVAENKSKEERDEEMYKE